VPIFWLCLIVSTIISAASERASGTTIDSGSTILACAAVLLCWAGVHRLVAAYAALRVDEGRWSAATAERFVDGWLPRLRWTWLPINALLLSVGQFAALAADHPVLVHSLTLHAAWLLLPSFVAMGWSIHCGDELQRYLAQKHRWFAVPTGLRSLWTESGWIVAPLVAVLLTMDLIGLITGVPGQELSSGWLALLIVVMPLLMPWLMSRVWRTASVKRFNEYQWLDELRAASGVRGVAFHVWPTGGRLSTAAAIGFVPGARLVLLTDGALIRLPRAQLSMVALHELAHLKRWHMPLRLAALLPGWGLAAVLAYFIFPAIPWLPLPLQGPLALTIGLGSGLWLLRWVSHATELDADREACRLALQVAKQVSSIPDSQSEAARQLAAALDTLTAGAPRARRRTWFHPSIDDRLAALLRIA